MYKCYLLFYVCSSLKVSFIDIVSRLYVWRNLLQPFIKQLHRFRLRRAFSIRTFHLLELTNNRRDLEFLSLTALRFYNNFTDSFTVVHYLQPIRSGVFLTPFAKQKQSMHVSLRCLFVFLCFALLCLSRTSILSLFISGENPRRAHKLSCH